MTWPPGSPLPIRLASRGRRGGAQAPDAADLEWLQRARTLAGRGWGQVHPNPMVGCVIVSEGKVVGEGWHARYGGPHAEVRALAAAGPAARGGTAYVSLEPCNHKGKTPPCTRALLEAGIGRVVYGGADPGDRSGGGGEALARAGVETLGPLLSPGEAQNDNPAFFHSDPHRPWAVLKLATSLDAGITRAPGERTPLTGAEANALVHTLRAGMDAILVGAGTARVDDPLLTVRGTVTARTPPIRILLDPGPDWGRGARILQDEAPVWVAVRAQVADDRRTRWSDLDVRVVPVPRAPQVRSQDDADDRVDLSVLMGILKSEGVSALLCEGGAQLGRSMMEAGLIDRLVLVTAPVTLGHGAVRLPHLPVGRWTPVDRPVCLGEDIWAVWDRHGPLRTPSTPAS